MNRRPHRLALRLLCLVALAALLPGCGKNEAKDPLATDSKEYLAFRLGEQMASTGLQNLARKSAADVHRSIAVAKALAGALAIDGSLIKEPRPLTGNKAEDMAHLLGYLMASRHSGSDVGKAIDRRHGARITAHYELPIKAWVGMAVYVPYVESALAKTSADTIERIAEDMGLPQNIYRNCVVTLREAKVPFGEMNRKMAAMLDRVEDFLKHAGK